MYKYFLLAILFFFSLNVSSAQTVYHRLYPEINGFSIANQPTTYPVYTHDGAGAVASVDVYYQVVGTEIAGSVKSKSTGNVNITFNSPPVGSYTMITSANKTGYTSTLNTTAFNTYIGVLNTTGNFNVNGPYQLNQAVTFVGTVREVSCCFFSENATSSCVCQYPGSVTMEYYVDDVKKGDVLAESDGKFQFQINTGDYSAGGHTLVVSAVKASHGSANYTKSFSILSTNQYRIQGAVKDATGTAATVSITITNSSGTQYQTTTSAYDVTLLEGSYTVAVIYGSYKITYPINLVTDISELIMVDTVPISASGLPLTMTVQSALGTRASSILPSSVTVEIPYSDVGVDESKLQVQMCSSWDFNGRACSGSWSIASASQDTSANKFTASASSMGGFAVGEGIGTCAQSTCGTTCTTKSTCEAVGCNYCGNYCTSSICTSCHSSNKTACTTEAECSSAGGYFYNNVCESSPYCTSSSKGYCTTESACTGVSGYWCADNTCSSTQCCSVNALDLCTVYDACTNATGHWCDGVCKSSCAVVTSNQTTNYIYLTNTTGGADSTILSFQISIFNSYAESMENVTVKLTGVPPDSYMSTPSGITLLPNNTALFEIKVNKLLAGDKPDLSYIVDYYKLDSVSGLIKFFSFTNPLDIDWVTLFVDFIESQVAPGHKLPMNITVSKTWEDVERVDIVYSISDKNNNVVYESSGQQFFKDKLTFEDAVEIYTNYTLGDYNLRVDAKIGARSTVFERNFRVVKKFPWLQFFMFIVLPAVIIISSYVYVKYIKKPPEYVAVPSIKFGNE